MESEPEYILPEPARFMSAKAYKQKIVDPFVRKIKDLFHFVLSRCCDAWDNYHRLDVANQNMCRENEKLSKANRKLSAENDTLRTENKNYQLLRKVFGKSQLEYLIEQAQKTRFPKQRESSVQKHREER